MLNRLSAISHTPPGRKVLVSAIAKGAALIFWRRLNAAARVHGLHWWRGGRVAVCIACATAAKMARRPGAWRDARDGGPLGEGACTAIGRPRLCSRKEYHHSESVCAGGTRGR